MAGRGRTAAPSEGRIERRGFLRAAAGSAGGLLLASCLPEPAPSPSGPSPSGPPAATPVPRPALARGLSREAVRTLAAATARTRMAEYQQCAQATFATLQELFGLEGDALIRALAPLPGIAERGETCGAVTAALLAFGLIFGERAPGGAAAWRQTLPPARAFCDRFVVLLGSTRCRELLRRRLGQELDLATAAGQEQYRGLAGPAACREIVQQAVGIAVEVILDQAPAWGERGRG